MKKGEQLRIEEKECEWPDWVWAITYNGKSGWVPKNYLTIEGDKAKMLVYYDATELTAFIGQELEIQKQESGWVWVISDSGEQGWIPLDNVEILK